MEEIPSQYDPKDVEKKWFDFWQSNDLFRANPNSKKPPFCAVMPPPNVTGVLHMGHVLGNTLQDLLVRYKRMCGYEVLWQPGTDHAGIATQTVVERNLIQKENKRRKDLKREDFEKLCYDWSDQHKESILSQIQMLGSSCDYSRLKFTLDPSIQKAVLKLFKKMFDEGLIYRGYYLVNWDPVTQTALADDEVEYEEKQDYLYYIKYPVLGSDEHVIIATTRPETMLGDTAVAVSAKDKRYLHLHDKKIVLPLLEKPLPVVLDHYVDPEFGTGVVKITPAHDPNDYEIGLRHNLAMINIMTPDGNINHNGGSYEGLSMQDAREKIVEKLKELNLLVKVEPYTHRVGTSYRSKAVIQPYLSKQWFIKMSTFKTRLKEAVVSNKVTLHPKNWENTYFHWIDNLRDWCISRQLWWGHQIPVWHNINDPEKMICHIEDGIPEEVEKNPNEWKKDPDVLDTWFSSALWPFSTLGWPQNSDELKKFYPNSLLLTGHDILFFWVARMLMMGDYALREFPFKDVILTGLIYGKSYWRKNAHGGITYVNPKERMEYDLGKEPPKDVFSKWEKISKSKGNAINPKEIIDLYGTCAMRMALSSTSCQLRQIDLDRRRFEEFKNFANKVWNGARFVLGHLKNLDIKTLQKGLDLSKLQLEDQWILTRLNQTVDEVNNSINEFHFDKAAMSAYNFFWNDFCAYYVEMVKPYLFDKIGDSKQKEQKQIILAIILLSSIRLLHPMAPFITEELFSHIKKIFPNINANEGIDFYTNEFINALSQKCCMTSIFPQDFSKTSTFENAIKDFEELKEVIYAIRNLRGEMKIGPQIKTDIYFEKSSLITKENTHILKALIQLKDVFIDQKCEQTFSSQTQIKENLILIPLPEELMEQEKARLEKEKGKKEQNIEGLTKKLSNENFIQRAPKELVEEQKMLLLENQKELENISKKLDQLSQC